MIERLKALTPMLRRANFLFVTVPLLVPGIGTARADAPISGPPLQIQETGSSIPVDLPRGRFVFRRIGLPVEWMTSMDQHPVNHDLYAVSINGVVFRIDPDSADPAPSLVVEIGKLGLEFTTGAQGLAFDHSGNMYVSNSGGDILKGVWNSTTDTFAWNGFVDLPEDSVGGDHGVNAMAEGPDGKLYINSGSIRHGSQASGPEPDFGWNARILRVNLDGTGLESFCRGIRNTFALTFRSDGALFGVENGPDCHYADELNRLEFGKHYGYPFAYGSGRSGSDSTLDLECVFPSAGETLEPAWGNLGPDGIPGPGEPGDSGGAVFYGFHPHSSPSGLSFYDTARMDPQARKFPGKYHGLAFVCRFGQLIPLPGDVGFDIVTLSLDDPAHSFSCRRFATGISRPVHLLCAWNGRVYVLEFNETTSGSALGSGKSRLLEIRWEPDADQAQAGAEIIEE